jgi:excisionase family DNA binding protein
MVGPRPEPVMTTGEVAKLFGVDPKTVNRWAHDGRLDSFRTPGGHLRFRESVVRAFLFAAERQG